jgi:hypothetical protein
MNASKPAAALSLSEQQQQQQQAGATAPVADAGTTSPATELVHASGAALQTATSSTQPVLASSTSTSQSNREPEGPALLSLGQLVTGVVTRRPSATVKTPYVADVQLEDGSTVLAHTPAMDCAGMITPGCRVHMTVNPPKKGGQQTKTSHTIWVRGERWPQAESDAALSCTHAQPVPLDRRSRSPPHMAHASTPCQLRTPAHASSAAVEDVTAQPQPQGTCRMHGSKQHTLMLCVYATA